MTASVPLHCPTCGAPVDPRSATAAVVVCAYCRAAVPLPSPLAPPRLALDLADAALTGWLAPERAYLSRSPTAPELVARFPPRPLPWTVLRSEGTFDACEVSATARFVDADESAAFGFYVRANPVGAYMIAFSLTGYYTVVYLPRPTGAPVPLVAWSPCSALRQGLGAVNAVSVACAGDRLTLTVNGRELGALRDARSSYGAVELFAAAPRAPVALAVSELAVRSVEDVGAVVAAPVPAPALGTYIDVMLTACGPNKIGLIKLVREQTGLGLKEAKDLVEAAPRVLRGALDRADAERLRRLVADMGGVAELRTAAQVTAHRADVVLVGARADQKMQLIAAVRNITGLGLAAAKTLVENVPCEVKTGLSADEATSAKRVLENAGGVVEVRG